MSKSWGIHWFRRDLRVVGNKALWAHCERHEGRVLGLFTFDDRFLARPDFSHDRFQFYLMTLKALRDDLVSRGGDLLVLGKGPDQGFELLKETLQKNNLTLPASVSWNRDYEPFARERDERLAKMFAALGIETFTERDHLLIEPHEILKPDGSPYQIYTPFAKAWFAKLHSTDVQSRLKSQRDAAEFCKSSRAAKAFDLTWHKLLGTHTPKDQFDAMEAQNRKHVNVPIPEAGPEAAWHRVKSFAKHIEHYGTARDIPSEDGTSKFSMYFKNGSLTVPQVIVTYNLETAQFKVDNGPTKFLQELVWREFYYYILWHSPRVETEAFQKRYRDLEWDNDPERFKAWKEGMTGFPIVDAGMRQLATTGWMHNRVRMIVSSFLTKDLLVDWRWGEKWFMERLLDGDLAPNNGGWQWAASTGCDAQPYFRIFNPESQSERFDAEGAYIRRYVPELRDVPKKDIHNPPPAVRKATGYPEEIVSHKKQRILALKLYKR